MKTLGRSPTIPVSEPLLGDRESQLVMECLRGGWISSTGPFVERFEEGWARICGRRHGVAVCNGTAALELSFAALGIGPGDEVILPTFTIISCALAVLRTGATPVLVDSDPRTWTLDVRQVRRRITPRTRAILAVHIYGHPADMDPILELADRHGLAVVEDAAEAHGAEYHRDRAQWVRCGSLGTLSCFSFYANKPVTTGEGGMVLTDDAQLAERCRSLRNLCFGSQQRFRHEALGYNFRMTNLQAALGLAQMERLEEIVARRRRIGREYTKKLSALPALQLPVEEPWARSVYWMFGVVVSEETALNAEEVIRRLDTRGVQTRPFFLGMHEQPVLRRRGLFPGESFPVAERLARQGLYLPSATGLSDGDLQRVVQAVQEALAP